MSHETQSLNRVRDQAQKQARDLNGFDYNAPAELYPSRIKKGRGRITYKRFNTAAEALQFAIEEIPAAVLLGAYLEVDEARFGVQEIRFLYDSAAYPLKRGRSGELIALPAKAFRVRHARLVPSHPRFASCQSKSWMPGTRPGMTIETRCSRPKPRARYTSSPSALPDSACP